MIASMTAFARKSQEANWGSITWEIRTLNHRYLEIAIRMPEPLRNFEKSVRNQIQQFISRGKIEAILRFQPGQDVPFNIIVNQSLAQQLAHAAQSMDTLFPNAHIDMTGILTWPGILHTKNSNMGDVDEAMLILLQETMSDLVSMRQREGAKIKEFMQNRLKDIQIYIDVIKKRMPDVLNISRAKIKTRFEKLAVNLDKERLEQEMVWLAQKMDIAEELQHLEAHVIEVRRVLEKENVVGRRLDFLMQELNREANTISSKSIDLQVTQAAIELRVQIEQMREQVQNVE